MIFAAGRGTRLRPLTDTKPKALVEVGGVPMLERTALRLVAAGADRLVVNVCPFADDIEAFVRSRDDFGVEVRFSREAEPLETGGGLLAARGLFRGDRPIVLHNADVFSDQPLEEMVAAHATSGAIATLAVMRRTSSRGLLFDDGGLLGRIDHTRDVRLEARAPVGTPWEIPFSGVHVIAPRLLARIEETGAFPILRCYLRLVAGGERIDAFRTDGCTWVDIGRPDQLEHANALAAESA